ncbi:hypothetical protein SLS60_003450 [Paraconiothyrium brasiliense]|uniref:poly(ADP-ribose) glycohydrolase n=1 Tax=Paraconiothyrium brasiliense TaxID=300254 RepID=A0ABR3RW41_9PLEO
MSTTPWPLFYTLPSCPTITTQDRFGLLDADTPSVPFWSVLSALLTPPVGSLPAFLEILEIIAVELRGTAPPDYNTLRSCLQAREAELLNTIWPKVKELALDMPRLFPMHRLPVLKDGGAGKVELSREQVGCLVAHQLLSTLAAPLWQDGFQNFEIWYQGEQPHVSAPEIYITAVLDYFAQIATAVKRPEWTVTYELSSQSEPFDHGMLQDRMKELGDIELRPMSEKTSESESLGTSGNAVVISANRFIGFGRSATQEEVFVGTTPEACPGVLVTPPLTDSQVLVVRGCEAVVKTVGQGRQIRMCGTHTKPHDEIGEEHRNKWRDRTMLFMDALELDSYDGAAYPDVEHANVEREMAKALRAFGSANYPRIYTGLWGCRTFGGDPEVKMTILWLAATVKESALVITYEEEREDFAQKLARFVDLVRARGYKVGDVWDLLWEAEGSGIAKWGFLDWVFGRR